VFLLLRGGGVIDNTLAIVLWIEKSCKSEKCLAFLTCYEKIVRKRDTFGNENTSTGTSSHRSLNAK